jgi:hypothetical protein
MTDNDGHIRTTRRLRTARDRALFPFLFLTLGAGVCQAQTSAQHTAVPTAAISEARVLSWLPADTETVIVARGPFPMPPARKDDDADDDDNRNHPISGEEVVQRIRLLALGTALFPKGVSEELFVGQEVALAVDGSRHFRPPSGLGGMLFEGAEIIVFTHDISARFNQLRKGPENLAATREKIEGRDVEVFTERVEEDNWTILVTLAKPDTIVFATNRDYLREVLARVDGAKGRRALPDELPEWKYVNLRSTCWGRACATMTRVNRTSTRRRPSARKRPPAHQMTEQSAWFSTSTPDSRTLRQSTTSPLARTRCLS